MSKKNAAEVGEVSRNGSHSATTKPSGSASGEVYQLKITLNNVKPPIWRRVQTKDVPLADLHALIQDSMGWSDGHMHTFEIGGMQYGDPTQWLHDDLDEVEDSRKVKLSQLVAQGIKKFRYVYDMGDNWAHTIMIEKRVPAEPGEDYPRCIDGKRACPPEDCGGPWGYAHFLEVLGDPKHPEHADMMEWSGGEFDPEAFDVDETNDLL